MVWTFQLISVATLSCESQNTESAILQWDITKENCIRCKLHQSRRLLWCVLNLLIWGVIQQCVYETKIHDIDNAWRKLVLTLAMTSATLRIDQWRGHLRCVRTVGGHFEHMLWYQFSFMWFTGTFRETVNAICCMYRLFWVKIKSWICIHMHFRCFDFHKVVYHH